MAFKPKGYGDGIGAFELEAILLDNSMTFNVGDVCQSYKTGFGGTPTKAKPLMGIIVGFVGPDGKPIQPSAYVPGTATGTDVTQVVTASNNTTVKTYYALVNTSRNARYSAQVNGTVNTTVNSGRGHVWISVDSDNTNYGRVLETTASRSAQLEFWCISPDVDDSTRLIVQISGSEKQNNSLTP